MRPGIDRAEGAAKIAAAARPDLEEAAATIDHAEVEAADQRDIGFTGDMKERHNLVIGSSSNR